MEKTESIHRPGLLGSLAALANNAMHLSMVRLELLALELSEVRNHVIALSAILGVLVLTAFFALGYGSAMLAALSWDAMGWKILLILFLVFAGIAVALIATGLSMLKQGKLTLASTMRELKHDRDTVLGRAADATSSNVAAGSAARNNDARVATPARETEPASAGGLLSFAKKLFHVMRSAVSEWLSHRAASKGAALAFYTMFSLAPILVLVIAVAGLFYGTDAAQGQLLGQLQGLVGKQGAEAIQSVLAGARNQDSGVKASIVATFLLLVGATSVFAELKDSLDEIWDVPKPTDSSWWDLVRTRILSFGLILVLGFLLMVSLVVSAALAVVDHYVTGLWEQAAVLLSVLAWLISFGVITALFAVILKFLPSAKLSWRDVAIGAIGTAALFELGKLVIGLYIGNSGVADSFGAAGSMIALLLWIYYSSQIFFLGAEFARQYAVQLGSLRNQDRKAPAD